MIDIGGRLFKLDVWPSTDEVRGVCETPCVAIDEAVMVVGGLTALGGGRHDVAHTALRGLRRR
jgi:hypothetical protein